MKNIIPFILTFLLRFILPIKADPYDELIIHVDKDLELNSKDREDFLINLEDLLDQASVGLYLATFGNLYLGNVTVVVPSDWDEQGVMEVGIQKFNADIQVSNVGFGGKGPYTLQPGVCGSPGLKISLPFDFVMEEDTQDEYGDPGKLLANELLKLRYGVYDEFGYPGDPWAPYSFMDLTTGETRVTSCTDPESLEGKWKDADGDSCEASELDPDCRMIITDSNANFSTLFVTHIDKIEKICTSETHDFVSPTIHNKICGMSAVSVMMQHPDFLGRNVSQNYTLSESDISPSINIVKMKYMSTLILLDANGGNDETQEQVLRIHDQVKVAIEILLQSANIDSLGLGLFNTSDATPAVDETFFFNDTTILTPIDQINMNEILDFFPESLTTSNESNPSEALTSAITALENLYTGESISILLIQVQGTTAVSPTVQTLKNDYYISGLLYGGEDNNDWLEDVVNEFEGTFYVDYRYQPLVASSAVLSLTSDVEIIVLHHETQTVSDENSTEVNVFIDSTVGTNTLFTIEWDGSKLGEVVLTDPDGNETEVSQIGNTMGQFVVISDAMEGFWNLILTSGRGDSDATVTVTTQPRADVDQVEIHAWSSANNLTHDLDSSPLAFFVSLRVGSSPIEGSSVYLKLFTTDDVDAQVDIMLMDDGAGVPDMTAGDGVYSCYLAKVEDFGLNEDQLEIFADLVVEVAEGKSFASTFKLYEQDPPQSRAMTENPFYDDPMPASKELPMERRMFNAISIGVTGAKNYDPPPGGIVDFRLKMVDGGSIDTKNVEATLTWTAPGEDFSEGTVKSYELRYTKDVQMLEDFETWDEIDEDLIIDGSLDPLESGMDQSVTISFEKSPGDVYFMAIRGVDKGSNQGDLSKKISIDANFTGLYVAPITEVSTSDPPNLITNPAPEDFVGSAAFIILIIFCSLIILAGIGGTAYCLMKGDSGPDFDDIKSKFKKKKRNDSLGGHHNHMPI